MTDSPAPSLTMLIKLLKMTTSSNDAEALVAMRKANSELAKFGGDWEAILKGKITVIGDPFADTPIPPRRAASAPPPPVRPAPPPPPQAFSHSFRGRPAPPPPPVQPTPRPAAPQPKQPAWAAKSAQTRKQRLRNPVTINDLI